MYCGDYGFCSDLFKVAILILGKGNQGRTQGSPPHFFPEAKAFFKISSGQLSPVWNLI